jgi:hypothetical protein
VDGVADVLGDALGLADDGRPFDERGMPTNVTIGVESCRATCSPLMALAAPGPRVTKQMPGSPVILPQASAIIDAPPSWRQMMVLMRLES